jgi:hypothetical protein
VQNLWVIEKFELLLQTAATMDAEVP